jgi:Domain of unknown function (DUF4382)
LSYESGSQRLTGSLQLRATLAAALRNRAILAKDPQTMKRTYSLTPAGSVLAVAALVAACGGGSNGTGTGVSTGTGTLSLSLTDAPACGYDKVFVTIEKVRVHQSSSAGDNDAGWSEIALVAPQRVDLLTLNNGTLLPLGQTELPAGTYTQMRLVLAPNTAANPLANAIMPTGGVETALTTTRASPSSRPATLASTC